MATANVTTGSGSNPYEEARKQRLEENKKRFHDLGILDTSKSLSNITKSEKKPKQQSVWKTKEPQNADAIEPRRSSRARKPVASYVDDDVDIDLPNLRKRSRSRSSSSSSSRATYIARPIEEVKIASYEDRVRALRVAEKFQSTLSSGYPSFVKSMVRSHVYSCFWLGLPKSFCKNHLPESDLGMILEDENGARYDAKYLGTRDGLSGGWRAFALNHKLDDGDAVVFELVEPDRFKVYTFRVTSSLSSPKDDADTTKKEASAGAKVSSGGGKNLDSHSSKKKKSKKAKVDEADGLLDSQETQPQNGTVKEAESETVKSARKDVLILEEQDKKAKQGSAKNSKEVQSIKEEDTHGKRNFKPRKKSEPRLFRKRG